MTTKEKVMINGITASLANAARKIVEDSRVKAAEESASNIAKLTEKAMKPAHSGTAPRNDQERKLAAMTPPKDKITHGDVLHGRGVRKEESEQVNEAPVDGVAPGSMEGDKHMCATKVFHKEWKEGKTLFSQHAEPDWNADGYISWYDVMFEHGIEKRVATSDLQILTQESHMHSKKKKM